MRAVLHTYQEQCVLFLERGRGGKLLLLDMGLGKTLITLTALSDMIMTGDITPPVLVVAPLATANGVWRQEAAKWDHTAHLAVRVACGSPERRLEAVRDKSADIVVINRENVPWLSEMWRGRWPYSTVVLDELSSFRNHRSKRWRALKAQLPRIERVWGLTGTPAPNGLHDLWAQVYLADRGERLGRTLGAYRARWFTPGRRSGHIVYDWVLKRGAADEIYAAIADIAVSMRAAEKLSLPRRTDNTVHVDLPAGARRAYDEMRRSLATEDVTALSAAAQAGKLRQIAGGAVYNDAGSWSLIHSAKTDALRAIVDEAQGQPILVFCNHRHEIERVCAALPQARAFDVGIVDAWNEGEVPVMVAHPASCGHGLNMQDGGHIAVWFGPTWDLELWQQANARLDRQGQRHPVTVHTIVARGTIDEEIVSVIEGKASLQEALMKVLSRRR